MHTNHVYQVHTYIHNQVHTSSEQIHKPRIFVTSRFREHHVAPVHTFGSIRQGEIREDQEMTASLQKLQKVRFS